VLPPAPGTVDLSSGEPDARLLPVLGPRLRRLASDASAPVSYRSSGCWPELVELATQRFAADDVPVATGAVTVTSGALDGIERLLTAHLRPGDKVGVEDPGWANLIDLVAALGLSALSLPVDAEGPTVDGLRRVLAAGAAAIVVTSRAQNPTGAAVSPRRAAQLRTLLSRHSGVLTIEDDHAAELAEVPLAPLAGATGSWAFLRSVSKPYGPDLRLAVLAGDEQTIARVEGRMRLGAGWVSTLLQRLVVAVWRDPAVASTVAHAAGEYARRRTAVVTALHRRGIAVDARSGINLWVAVPDENLALAALREAGWSAAPGSLYRLDAAPGIRLTIATLDLSTVDSLADAVAAAVTGARPPTPGATR
jgi:DNA-binding transcriptional MocR family regulator